MKKTLIALAVLGAISGAAYADSSSSLTVYGDVDLGLSKGNIDSTTKMRAGDDNRIGFRGVEDLGGQFKAFFDAQIWFNPSNGTNSNPLFGGKSVAGLEGVFGKFAFGRDLTPVQTTFESFDAWGNKDGRGAFQQNIIDADYYSNTQYAPQTSGNVINKGDPRLAQRFNNAVFYNSPVFVGIQINAAVGTKQDDPNASSNPYSISATWGIAGFGLGLGYEQNARRDQIGLIGVSYDFGIAKIMASYSQKSENDRAGIMTPKVTGAQIGADIDAGPGKVLLGYGVKSADGVVGNANMDASKLKQASIGYQYGLSKRTYVYVDYINQKITGNQYNWFLTSDSGSVKSSNNTWDIGLHHAF